MTPEQMYHELILVAEKFDVSVSEQNLQSTGLKIRSGFCIIKEKKRFIIDKQLSTLRKIDLLASFISSLPHETIFIIPALREEIHRHAGIRKQESVKEPQ